MRRYILLLLLATACSHPTSRQAEQIQSVKCSEAVALRYTERDFAALSTADDAVNLAFKISGRIVNLPVAKGMSIKKGQVLAELDPRDVELQVEAARATFKEQESRLQRAQRLLEHNAISQQEVESLESTLTQARSAYENSP
ncbi:MAG: biotin/lipoyl-binding protein, partial [Alistipes sp.]|nr:biotin/lipoyl-binding protein [Alistipes sp.]